MSSTKAIVGVFLVFFMGMVTGVAVSMKFVERRIQSIVNEGPEAMSEMIFRRLDHSLKLDAQQRSEVVKIIETSRPQIAAVQSESQPKIDRIVDDSAAKIRAILKPAQVEKFNALLARSRTERAAQ